MSKSRSQRSFFEIIFSSSTRFLDGSRHGRLEKLDIASILYINWAALSLLSFPALSFPPCRFHTIGEVERPSTNVKAMHVPSCLINWIDHCSTQMA